MTGLDLTGPADVLRSLMVDTLLFERDAERDAVLDDDDGHLDDPAPEVVAEVVGFITPLTAELLGDPGTLQAIRQNGSTYGEKPTHRAIIDLGTGDDIAPGHECTVTAVGVTSLNPLLLGQRYEVTHLPAPGTLDVCRFVYLKAV